jgi:hypothetical protein
MTQVEIINELLKLTEKKRYLEVGSCGRITFERVKADLLVDIEPNPEFGKEPLYRMSSDEAFSRMNSSDVYDVIFIDGLHHCEQVARDTYNACQHLSDDGFIVIHDCYPREEFHQTRDFSGGSWTGDVWKFQAWLVQRFKNVWTIPPFPGCGIIRGSIIDYDKPTLNELLTLTWKDFSNEAVRLTEWNELWS